MLSKDTGLTFDTCAPAQPPFVVSDGAVHNVSNIVLAMHDPASVADFLACKTDTGWVHVSPADTTAPFHWVLLEPVVAGFEPSHFFVLGGKIDTSKGIYGRITDYYETVDGGVHWQANSTIAGGRVVRLSNPAPNFLVALVGRSPYTGNLMDIPKNFEVQGGIPEKLVDSIFMSLDGGLTWIKDGKSFAGDTITDMWWVSSKLGYVISYRDGSSYLSRYDAPSGSVEGQPTRRNLNELILNPNPVTTHFSFPNTLPDVTGFIILNALGETAYSETKRIGISEVCRVNLPVTLPAGCYELCVRGSGRTLTSVFIKL